MQKAIAHGSVLHVDELDILAAFSNEVPFDMIPTGFRVGAYI